MTYRVAELLTPVSKSIYKRPLFVGAVSAGLPEEEEEWLEGELDMNEYLLDNPEHSYYLRVKGDSMLDVGIHPGDVVVVDRTKRPLHDDIAVVVIDNQLTVKKLSLKGPRLCLVPANKKYQPIEVKDEQDCEVWGVVTAVVHKFKRSM